jgi:hypothetical protein
LITNDAGTALGLGPYLTNNGVQLDSAAAISGAAPSFSIELVVRFTVADQNTILYAQGINQFNSVVVVSLDQAPWPAQVRFQVIDNVNGAGGALIHSTSTLSAGVTYHIVVTFVAGSAARIYIDGVDVSDGTAAGSGTIDASPPMIGLGVPYAVYGGSPDAVIGEVAVYNTALSAARVAAHSAAGHTAWQGDTPAARLGRILDARSWPAALRDLDTGSSTLQSAKLAQSVLEHAQKVADSDFGDLFMTRDGKVAFIGRTSLLNRVSAGTFGDGAGELKYAAIGFDNGDQLIRNPVTVSRSNGVAQTSSDAAGLTEYLDHQYTLDGLYHDSDSLSKDAADFLVSEYKDPKSRVTSLVVKPQRDPANLWPVVLGAELGDVFTVIRRPQGIGSPISQNCEIQGIKHDINPGEWTVTFTLSPAYTGAFLQLNLTSGPGLGALRLYF